MPLVIDTLNDYFFYLQYRRRNVAHTIKANKLALQYFTALYGHTATNRLTPTHLVRFYQYMHNKKRLQKNGNDTYEDLSKYTIYKVMVKLRSYIKWLESERLL